MMSHIEKHRNTSNLAFVLVPWRIQNCNVHFIGVKAFSRTERKCLQKSKTVSKPKGPWRWTAPKSSLAKKGSSSFKFASKVSQLTAKYSQVVGQPSCLPTAADSVFCWAKWLQSPAAPNIAPEPNDLSNCSTLQNPPALQHEIRHSPATAKAPSSRPSPSSDGLVFSSALPCRKKILPATQRSWSSGKALQRLLPADVPIQRFELSILRGKKKKYFTGENEQRCKSRWKKGCISSKARSQMVDSCGFHAKPSLLSPKVGRGNLDLRV